MTRICRLGNAQRIFHQTNFRNTQRAPQTLRKSNLSWTISCTVVHLRGRFPYFGVVHPNVTVFYTVSMVSAVDVPIHFSPRPQHSRVTELNSVLRRTEIHVFETLRVDHMLRSFIDEFQSEKHISKISKGTELFIRAKLKLWFSPCLLLRSRRRIQSFTLKITMWLI